MTFQAFMTLVSNALRVAAINSVGDFVLFLGKIGVCAATGAVGIFWFKVSLISFTFNNFSPLDFIICNFNVPDWFEHNDIAL